MTPPLRIGRDPVGKRTAGWLIGTGIMIALTFLLIGTFIDAVPATSTE